MCYYVYVLRSVNFDRYYTGMTSNPEKRLVEHNSGLTKSTKPFIPWEIVFLEKFETRTDARKREKYLKSGSGREFLKNWTRSTTE
ncbi:MAG: GIY-YIG nuclease family protein [Bacteroidota bacterium]